MSWTYVEVVDRFTRFGKLYVRVSITNGQEVRTESFKYNSEPTAEIVAADIKKLCQSLNALMTASN